jgi:hypothetical protein
MNRAPLVALLVVFMAMAAVCVVLAPRVIAPGLRMMQPISRMKQSQKQLEQLETQSTWKRPEAETLTADQLDRFFAVRQRIDAARRGADPHLDRLPRKHVRSLEELRQVPDIIQGVSDVVTGELDAYVAGRMTPEEYHWVGRIVYGHWRGALKRAGRYPAALRAAASEVEMAAAREPDRRVKARLEALGVEMRGRTPDPPEGFDPETHRLLLARLDDVERWSLDDTETRLPR